MAKTEAQKAAQKKWDEENMVTVAIKVRKTLLEEVKAKAEAENKSVYSIVKNALEQYVSPLYRVDESDSKFFEYFYTDMFSWERVENQKLGMPEMYLKELHDEWGVQESFKSWIANHFQLVGRIQFNQI